MDSADRFSIPSNPLPLEEDILNDKGVEQALFGSDYPVSATNGNNDRLIQQQFRRDEENDSYTYIDEEEEKQRRKRTGNSEGTSVTASSSSIFLDEGSESSSNYGNINYEDKQKQPLTGLAKLFEAERGEDPHEEDTVSDGGVFVVESRCWKWSKRIIGFAILVVLLGLLVVLIGAAAEKRHFANANDTQSLYQTSDVCGVQNVTGFHQGTTYGSVQEAHQSGDMVVHCGPCGACSTSHDLEIMATTAHSLTSVTARCAFKSFLGRRSVRRCMEKRIGFTSDCQNCWLNNIHCSFKSCKFSCIKWKLFRQDNNKGESLNDCLKCDERMCGPQFIACSGSNRRRMGIVSDIERDTQNEQCSSVDVDWLNLYSS